ncbi:hypothetical protein AC578_5688 [Pseudocercospora eumusae]|uniref:Uncharacterized protein n=1 Tax=Pseudocercospora eumusae TaxID=321146 RepID=A0A139H3K1_9PEZI|nr:hypothetical protein AC578_5688 [Pseudocercospora eumusae]
MPKARFAISTRTTCMLRQGGRSSPKEDGVTQQHCKWSPKKPADVLSSINWNGICLLAYELGSNNHANQNTLSIPDLTKPNPLVKESVHING